MERSEFAYNLALHTLGLSALALLRSRVGDDPRFWRGRLGDYSGEARMEGSPRIWAHAASVGETTGAIPTLHELRRQLPGAALFLTVGTPQGFRFARAQAPEGVRVLPFPLDFPRVLYRAFKWIRPDLYVGFEGEFWPNLFRRLESGRVPAVLLNGRLSKRSAARYRLLGPLFRPIFRQFSWLAMHSEEDRENALSVGASSERTLVLGSSKYDALRLRARPEKAERLRALLDLPGGVPVVVGGSLRRSECATIPDTFLQLEGQAPGLIGIFAPRHLERVPEMARLLTERSIPFQLFTRIEMGRERREARVVLVDRIGVLFDLYGLGDLIFCGGTLEPIGGHNILEPAAWGKAVFYGPHVQKVFYEHEHLRAAGGGLLVEDADALLKAWSSWIERLPQLEACGRRAEGALEALGGVVAKQVDLILDVLR